MKIRIKLILLGRITLCYVQNWKGKVNGISNRINLDFFSVWFDSLVEFMKWRGKAPGTSSRGVLKGTIIIWENVDSMLSSSIWPKVSHVNGENSMTCNYDRRGHQDIWTDKRHGQNSFAGVNSKRMEQSSSTWMTSTRRMCRWRTFGPDFTRGVCVAKAACALCKWTPTSFAFEQLKIKETQFQIFLFVSV